MQTYPNLKSNRPAEILLLIGLVLHIVYIIAIFSGAWNDIERMLMWLMALATIPYAFAYYSIKKKPTYGVAMSLIVISLFCTHFVIAILFAISAILTISIVRHNKNEVRRARVNL